MMTDDFKDLLSRAFAAARQRGKRDWQRMTVAVLKNRLLQMTERNFDEKAYGNESFLELVARHSDLVTIDRSTMPPTVEWRQAGQADESADEVDVPSALRIRPDLWKAVLDYSSGREYEWEPTSGQARPVEQARPKLRLPSVAREKLGEWRSVFAAEHESKVSDQGERQRLKDWASIGLGTQYLPRTLQRSWNTTIKTKVAEILTSWFASSGLDAPEILVSTFPVPTSSAQAELRSLIHRCIDVMSTDELRDLKFSAQILFRVSVRSK